jgi:transposase-like protein
MKRIDLLFKMDGLLENCNTCTRPKGKSNYFHPEERCKGCDVYTQLREIGNQLGGVKKVARLEMTVDEFNSMVSEGMLEKDIAKKKGVTPATLWNWKKKHLQSTKSNSKPNETNSPRKEKEQPQEDYRSVIDSLKRKLEVRKKAIKDLEEQNEVLKETTVPKKEYDELFHNFEEFSKDSVSRSEFLKLHEDHKVKFDDLSKKYGILRKSHTVFEESYHNERSLVIKLDGELENVREQLRKAEGLNEVYKQENEHLRGLIRVWA